MLGTYLIFASMLLQHLLVLLLNLSHFQLSVGMSGYLKKLLLKLNNKHEVLI